jgi:hypothetical protein
MARAKGKDVTTTNEKAVVPAKDMAALRARMQEDAGAGFEEATRDAYAVPFLRILQDLSPQVKKKMEGYIEGARPGMLFNTATKELFESVRVIPCYFSQVFLEWIPRDDKAAKKAGFVASHPVNTPLAAKAVREGSKNMLPNGHELSDTRQHFVLYQRKDGTWDQALISLSSSAIKRSKPWMTAMRAAHPDIVDATGRPVANPPMFACSYLVHGKEEEANEQGSWHVWSFEDRQALEDVDLYDRALSFRNAMREGKATISYEEARDDAPATTGSRHAAPPADGNFDDEIPDA